MVNIVCDSCKKTIQGAEKDLNVVYLSDKNLCFPCNEKLKQQVKEEMLKERDFTLKKYHDKQLSILNRMCR